MNPRPDSHDDGSGVGVFPGARPDPGRLPSRWTTARGVISLDEPLVVGILNVTPDSFSDGGELATVPRALRRAEAMAEAGARMLDVGGESTRPGAQEVSEAEELRRVLPVIEALERELGLPLSIDTRKAEVARQAVDAGAAAVNDVSGLSFDMGMAEVVARQGAGLILMHMRGTPADMMERATYEDVSSEVAAELNTSLRRALAAGVEKGRIALDPGIGFAKTTAQSLGLLRDIPELTALGYPVMVGPSRKSFLGELLQVPPSRRVVGTAVACALAWERGAQLFRVHDVEETVHALAVARAVGSGALSGDPLRPAGVEVTGAQPGSRRGENSQR